MKFKGLKYFFGSDKPKLEEFISRQRFLKLSKENGIGYLLIDKLVGTKSINELLKVLRNENYLIAFHDNVHPTISDPGAYFSYST